MRLGSAEVEKERLLVVCRDERPGALGHSLRRTPFEVLLEMIDLLGRHVILADRCRTIPGFSEQDGQRLEIREADEMMVAVLVPVLPVGVIVQPAEDDRPAGTAACGGAEGLCEPHSLGGQCVEPGRLDDRIAVTARIARALVVNHVQHDVSRRSFLRGRGAREARRENQE